ncbi:MAG: class I SAM-dependent methyltransferase [Bacteroidota bacterium]
MSDQDYWKEFWNKNQIIDREGIHEKVGRTIKGVPITDEKWNASLKDIEDHLLLNKEDDVVDIAAGSGALAIPFSEKVRSYTALDISEKLLENLKKYPKINTIHADALQVDLGKENYSKAILYFALQHFNESECIILLEKIFKCLKPEGICLIGDIPDEAKKFTFFNTPEREKAYFDSVKKNEPIIGTWFDKQFLLKAGHQCGFGKSIIINQPNYHINSHYRFDLKLIK